MLVLHGSDPLTDCHPSNMQRLFGKTRQLRVAQVKETFLNVT